MTVLLLSGVRANNFGGKSGLYGKLQFFADEVNRILKGPYKKLRKGIGMMPEGIDNKTADTFSG
ncbi:MAG: alpha-N-acetylglucosaminidase TIM-barrel domain-containing protein [Candidatus Saccharimonadales bacterium]